MQTLLSTESVKMNLLDGLRAEVADLKGRLQTVCYQNTKLELKLSDARRCGTNARNEFTNQLFEIQISFNKLGVELSEKESETLKANRKLSKSQKELEKMRTELVNSKDAESRRAQGNAVLYARNDNVTATQKRLAVETATKLTATETKLGTTEAALAAKQRALEDAQAKLEKRETDTPCSICLEKSMDTPTIRNVYLCALFMLPLQYMYMFSYPTLSGILFFLVEFLWSVFLLKQLYCTGIELRESKHKLVEMQRLLPKEAETMNLLGVRAQIADLKGRLQTECDSHQKTKLELKLSDARLCRANALVDETRKEFTNQLFKIQTSFNKLGVELSEKETETLKTNRKLSETQKEVEKLRTELVNSKDAESRLAEINAELYAMNDNITATQTRLANETATKLTATETKLGTTEAALAANQRALEDAKTKLENRETDNSCSICLDSDRNTAMLPCGHASTCYNCSLTLHRRDNAKCPVCRQLIDQIIKIYL